MPYDFDQIIERRDTDCIKWRYYGQDVLPLWVADMDFRSPEPVIEALQRRVEHGVFGYAADPPGLREAIVERLGRLYDWHVEPQSLVFFPGVVSAFNLTCRALAEPGEGVLVQTPVYPPMLAAPGHHGQRRDEMELSRGPDGRYSIDLDAFERAIKPDTRLFMLCNPHNPVGRVFLPDELAAMAEICLRHDMYICSDEIHCDLLFSGYRHTPIASLDPEIAVRTITLMAPSKTFNIAGLECSFAVVENVALRERLQAVRGHLLGYPNVLGFTAALAAYTEGQPWLDELLAYLEGNRDWLSAYLAAHLPQIGMSPVEGTYLAWLDCRQANLADKPYRFFLEQARVALNEGPTFGQGGEGFVRLNFGCPRSILVEALERMRAAIES